MLVLSTAAQVAALADLQTAWQAAGSTGPLTAHLYQNDYVPSPASVLADFTEADFDGYADVDLTLLVGPYLNPQGQPEIQNASVTWAMTGTTTPNTIFGYYFTTLAGAYHSGERFDSPRPMLDTLSLITLLFSFILIPGGISAICQPLDS